MTHHPIIHNNHFVFYTCLVICVHPAKHPAKRGSKARGTHDPLVHCVWGSPAQSPPTFLATNPNPNPNPNLNLNLIWWCGEKATSGLWGTSISLTTQAAPSWVDLGNVFNVASRISKPFTEQIYSSCCSQASFNSTLEFYLFPWSCQPSCVIGKEAFTEVKHLLKWAMNGVKG